MSEQIRSVNESSDHWRKEFEIIQALFGNGDNWREITAFQIHERVSALMLELSQLRVKAARTTEPQFLAATAVEPRACTCHPDDNPPHPCAQKYALSECRNTSKADKPKYDGHHAWGVDRNIDLPIEAKVSGRKWRDGIILHGGTIYIPVKTEAREVKAKPEELDENRCVPDNSKVICPNCVYQFGAISVDDQKKLRDAQHKIDWAWAIIANVGEGNWDQQTKDWQRVALDWEKATKPYGGDTSTKGEG